MRFGTVLTALSSLTVLLVSAADDGLNLVASASFPETNAFNYVVNGQKNAMTVNVEKKSDDEVTITRISAALLHPDTNALLKNLTSQKYSIPLASNPKIAIPYSFHSEFKPGDHRLNIWVEHTTNGKLASVEAYDSIVTIVDPDFSVFDLKMLSTYLIVAAFFAGLAYLAYHSFMPQKKFKSKKATSVSAPIGTVTATGAGGYQEEWIPEHHLRKSKSTKKAETGDELSAGDASGGDGKKKKTK